MYAVANLLDLVHKLIDYGRELASTLHQRSTTDPHFTRSAFGISDIALILTRITRGLHLAGALEARLARRAAHPDTKPKPADALSPPRPCTTQPPAQRTERVTPDPTHLPTPEQIAARVRRQPIGAAIADICRDLGITPSHKLWREVQLAIIAHGGSLARLMKDLVNRAFPTTAPAAMPAAAPASFPPSPALACTGPP